MRDVMEKFSVRLSDGQFKELLTIVDPTHSNEISYHKFLDLFEPKEDPIEGHKWLNSSHRFNDVQKPAVLAWQTVQCSVHLVFAIVIAEMMAEYCQIVISGLSSADQLRQR